MLKQIVAGTTIAAVGIGAGFAGGAVYKDKTIDVTQTNEYKHVVEDNQELNTKLDATQITLSGLAKQRDSLEETKVQLETRLETAQLNLNNKTIELEAKQSELKLADEQITALNLQITTLETNAQADANQITFLQEQVATLTAKKMELENQIGELNTLITNLNTQVFEKQTKIDDLDAKINELGNRINDLAKNAKLDVSALNAAITNRIVINNTTLVTANKDGANNIYAYNSKTGNWHKVMENASISVGATTFPKEYCNYLTIQTNGVLNLYSFKDFQLKQLTFTSSTSGDARYCTEYNGLIYVTMPSSNSQTTLYSINPVNDIIAQITSYKNPSVIPYALKANNYLVLPYQGSSYNDIGLKSVNLDTNDVAILISPETYLKFSDKVINNKVLLTRAAGIYEVDITTRDISEVLLYADSEERFCTLMANANSSNKAAYIYSVNNNDYYIWSNQSRILFNSSTKSITYLGDNYCYLGAMSGKAFFTYSQGNEAYITSYDEQGNIQTSSNLSSTYDGSKVFYNYPYADDLRLLLYDDKIFIPIKDSDNNDSAYIVYDSITNASAHLIYSSNIPNNIGWESGKRRIVKSAKVVEGKVIIEETTGDVFEYDKTTNSLKQTLVAIS